MLKPFHSRHYRPEPNPAAFRRLCVETESIRVRNNYFEIQPPSGGCVLKLIFKYAAIVKEIQPPSGGCVLKQGSDASFQGVESQPPSGGCVLKHMVCLFIGVLKFQPPSGGCVLKRVA